MDYENFKEYIRPVLDLDIHDKTYEYHDPPRDTIYLRFFNWYDVTFAVTMGFVFFCLRLLLADHIFYPWGKSIGIKRKKLSKWEENCWYMVYYPSFFILGLFVLSTRNYANNPYHYFTNWPTTFFERDQLLSFYYLGAGGFYFQSTVALITFETRRKDFVEMIFHHFFTLVLIAVSWSVGHDRFGCMVLILHDFVDIFLYTTKCLHYAGFEGLKNISFVIFALAYLISRMLFYPIRVIYPTMYLNVLNSANYFYKVIPMAGTRMSGYGLCIADHCVSSYWFLVAFMSLLYLLHIFWFYLIIRMIKRALFVQKLEKDIRSSDDEDEDEYHEKKD